MGRTGAYKFILVIVSPLRALYPCYQGPNALQALFHLIPTIDAQGRHYSFKDGETETHTMAATLLKSPNKRRWEGQRSNPGLSESRSRCPNHPHPSAPSQMRLRGWRPSIAFRGCSVSAFSLEIKRLFFFKNTTSTSLPCPSLPILLND